MDVLPILFQVSSWLVICIECAALFFVFFWSAVRGKKWMVAALMVLLFYSLLSSGLQAYVEYIQKNMMGPEAYQNIMIFSLYLRCLELLGKTLFLIAVFQLGLQLKRFVSFLSTDSDARRI